MTKKTLKKDINTILLIDKLAKLGKTKKVFSVIAKMLSKPKHNQITVNLTKLNRTTKEGQTIIIPGKLLNMGELNHKLTIYTHKISKSTHEKLKAVGCNIHNFDELLSKQPSKTTLIG